MNNSVLRRFGRQQWPPSESGIDGALGGVNGEQAGRSGGPARQGFAAGWLLIVGLAASSLVANAMTVHADYPAAALWEAWLWEGSSTFTLVVLAWLPGLMVLTTLRQRGQGGVLLWSKLAAVCACSVMIFSGLHVLGMLAIRHGVYAALGKTYHYGSILDRFPYELRKDLLTYAIFATFFWLTARKRDAGRPNLIVGVFDIFDGKRMCRTPLTEILAVTSAGNYVEFILADGQRPLMRTTLTAVQRDLEKSGFVRTHRKWLVNGSRLTALSKQGSGDWAVELGSLHVPLSRRFTDALAGLRHSRA